MSPTSAFRFVSLFLLGLVLGHATPCEDDFSKLFDFVAAEASRLENEPGVTLSDLKCVFAADPKSTKILNELKGLGRIPYPGFDERYQTEASLGLVVAFNDEAWGYKSATLQVVKREVVKLEVMEVAGQVHPQEVDTDYGEAKIFCKGEKAEILLRNAERHRDPESKTFECLEDGPGAPRSFLFEAEMPYGIQFRRKTDRFKTKSLFRADVILRKAVESQEPIKEDFTALGAEVVGDTLKLFGSDKKPIVEVPLRDSMTEAERAATTSAATLLTIYTKGGPFDQSYYGTGERPSGFPAYYPDSVFDIKQPYTPGLKFTKPPVKA